MTKSIHRARRRAMIAGRAASHETHEKNLSIGVFLASEPGARCRLERQDALIGLVINYIFLEMDLSVCADHFPPQTGNTGGARQWQLRRLRSAPSGAQRLPSASIWAWRSARRSSLSFFRFLALRV